MGPVQPKGMEKFGVCGPRRTRQATVLGAAVAARSTAAERAGVGRLTVSHSGSLRHGELG